MNNRSNVPLVFYPIVLLCYLNGRCTPDICVVGEKYENGNAKWITCAVDEKNGEAYVNGYYENGQIRYEKYFKNFVQEGLSLNYYSSGAVEAKKNFLNGKEHGDSWFYNENGQVQQYVYYFEGNLLYQKDFTYQGSEISISEGYFVNVVFENDTVVYPNGELQFEVSLQLPDSLLKNKKFFFAYQMNPLSLKDSVILDPVFRVALDNKTPVKCSLEISDPNKILFYGHLYDENEQHIYYYPIEDTIYFKQ